MQEAVRVLLRWCGTYHAEQEYFEDLDLEETPARMARMWKNELLSSYRSGSLKDLKDRFTVFELQKTAPREMIVQKDIGFYSQCTHHLVPFFGTVAVGYIPGKYIVGLSKIARVVNHFSRQLQLQERLTSQVADFLHGNLEATATIVVVKAEHLCMAMRGVQKLGAVTVTSALRGIAEDNPTVQQEFYRLIG